MEQELDPTMSDPKIPPPIWCSDVGTEDGNWPLPSNLMGDSQSCTMQLNSNPFPLFFFLYHAPWSLAPEPQPHCQQQQVHLYSQTHHQPNPWTTTTIDAEQVATEREIPGLDFMGGPRIPPSTQLKLVEAGLAAHLLGVLAWECTSPSSSFSNFFFLCLLFPLWPATSVLDIQLPAWTTHTPDITPQEVLVETSLPQPPFDNTSDDSPTLTKLTKLNKPDWFKITFGEITLEKER